METEKGQITRIYNGEIITPERNFGVGTVLIAEGKIIGIEPGNYEVPGSIGHDAHGGYIAPGFIDLHTHGAGDSDFMDCTEEDCLTIAREHLRHGTTLLYPTTLASDNQELFRFLDIYDRVKDQRSGAAFGGLHLEGPYFAYAFRGAQDPRYLRNPSPEEYMEILDRSQDVVEAVKHGFTHITHFYSCMNGVTRRNAFRYAGCVEAGYLLDEITIELITDGVHVPAPLMKLAVKNKGAEKIALVTDSMRGAGMPEGKSILGSRAKGREVLIEDGVAKMPDRQSFAGSVATADRLVRNMYRMGERPLEEAVRMMTLTPAEIMGIADRKGKIAKGYDADIVIFAPDIHINRVFINGETLFEQP